MNLEGRKDLHGDTNLQARGENKQQFPQREYMVGKVKK